MFHDQAQTLLYEILSRPIFRTSWLVSIWLVSAASAGSSVGKERCSSSRAAIGWGYFRPDCPEKEKSSLTTFEPDMDGSLVWMLVPRLTPGLWAAIFHCLRGYAVDTVIDSCWLSCREFVWEETWGNKWLVVPGVGIHCQYYTLSRSVLFEQLHPSLCKTSRCLGQVERQTVTELTIVIIFSTLSTKL